MREDPATDATNEAQRIHLADPQHELTHEAELEAAWRDLDAACEERGATIGCIRAPGGPGPAEIRAIARIIRSGNLDNARP